MKTWKIESFVVFIILLFSLLLKPIEAVDIICMFAVWVTFMHAQVADRMQEKQAKLIVPDVECYKWSNRYFLIKELLWICFFLVTKSYPALIGSVVFFMYPYYRKYYKKFKKS